MKAIPRALLAAVLLLAGVGCMHQVQAVDDSDPAIKARIEAQMRGRKDLDIQFVSLDVTNGVVTISGVVTSMDQIQTINKLIRLTHGVDSLLNNLVIQE